MLLAFKSQGCRRFLRMKLAHKITNGTIFSRVDRKVVDMQKAIRREMSLFEHVVRLDDDRKRKTVILVVKEGKNKGERSHREWADDTGVTGVKIHCRKRTE